MTVVLVGEHLNLFLQTDFIVAEAEKLVLQKKAEIYQSLVVSIQNDLLLCYEGMTITFVLKVLLILTE